MIKFETKKSLLFPTMSDILGFLKITVQRGINLAIRDTLTSDPYVVIHIGQQVRSIPSFFLNFVNKFSIYIYLQV